MTKQEFEILRNLPNKTIESDIIWQEEKGMGPNLIFKGIEVINSIGILILVNGTYKPRLPSVTFNFVVNPIGPICRIDVNGSPHKDAGRTHKHELQEPDDSKKNLPYAITRLDLNDKTPYQVWRILCKQANIIHKGKFVEPR